MERVTFKTLFYVKKTRVAKNGEVPVMLRVTVNGLRAETSVNLKVNPKRWNAVAGRSIGDTRKDYELNARIDTIRARVMQAHRQMELDGERITAQGVINRYLGRDTKPVVMLLDLFREHNEKCAKLSGNGVLWIRKKRQKTGNMCNIPLLDPAREILERYKCHPICEEKGVLLPVISNQKMNAYLAEPADICGITKKISSHAGRHSFGTSVCLANGVSIENVAKMLGHSDTKMTRHYARVLDKSIMRDMAIVNSKFATKPTATQSAPETPVPPTIIAMPSVSRRSKSSGTVVSDLTVTYP